MATINATAILCTLLLSLYLLLAVFWTVRSVIETIDDRRREKRNAVWEAERQQLKKERALREAEYHEARTRQIVILIQRVVEAIPPPTFHYFERMCL